MSQLSEFLKESEAEAQGQPLLFPPRFTEMLLRAVVALEDRVQELEEEAARGRKFVPKKSDL